MALVTNWITKLPRLKNSKVARFSYKEDAYANDDIEGVENYDYSRDMNVPLATHTDFDPSMLSIGARAQFSSIPKNGLNHFFGRVSYNLNKVIDFLADFLTDFISLEERFTSFTEIVEFTSSATLSNYANGTTKRLLNTSGSDITITLPAGETYLGSNTILLAPSIMLTIAKRGAMWINSSGNAISSDNATTADKWKTSRNITISDADGTNTGAAVSVDGSENETLKLPSIIKANLTGNASTATFASKANVRVSLRHGTTWFSKTWGGVTNFYGKYVWTDGENIYHSFGSSAQYVLNKANSTWSKKTWTGLTRFYNEDIWTDGENIYYSNGENQYVLNKTNSTWSSKTWSGLTNFNGRYIWTDGENIYYSLEGTNQVLNKSTSTWTTKTWSGLTSFSGYRIWTDGEGIYYSYEGANYVLNKTNSTWSSKTWSGLTNFHGRYIWTDGGNIYYSNGENQYVLNKATSSWASKTWSGLTDFYGVDVWTDGENIYHSFETTHYVLPSTRHNYVDENKYQGLFGVSTSCNPKTLSKEFVFSNE